MNPPPKSIELGWRFRREATPDLEQMTALEATDTEDLPAPPHAPARALPRDNGAAKGASPATTSSPAYDNCDRSSSDELPDVTDERISVRASRSSYPDVDSLFTGLRGGNATDHDTVLPRLPRHTSWEHEPEGRRSQRIVDPQALDGVVDFVRNSSVDRMLVSPAMMNKDCRSIFARCVRGLQAARPLAVVVWLFDFTIPDPFAGSLLGFSVPQAYHAEIYIVGLPPPNLFAFGAQGMRTAYVPYETYAAYGPPPNSILQGSEADSMPFSSQLVVGYTTRAPVRVHSAFRGAKKRGWHEGYHLLRKNCCCFVKEMAHQLLGPGGLEVVQDINYWGDVLPEWLQDTIHASFIGDESDTEEGDSSGRDARGRLNTM
jgi:hypothetical protein